MADRFFEHPHTVLVITNLNYSEAPRLMPRDAQLAAALNWQEVRLTGRSPTNTRSRSKRWVRCSPMAGRPSRARGPAIRSSCGPRFW
jgi:hypothetical protein